MFYSKFAMLERLGGDKRSSLFAFVVSDEEKKVFMSFAPVDLQDWMPSIGLFHSPSEGHINNTSPFP
jgi:hypothetical protein